jgi:acyl dehydratase
MPSTQTFHFTAPPSIWGLYPRILAARKPVLAREGEDPLRIEAALSPVRVPGAQLARYRQLAASRADAPMPVAYPHILASPLHLAMLSSNRFPVRLLGLVHVRNRIEQHGPLPLEGGGRLETALDGYRDTERGQEFDLRTRWLVDGQLRWSETTTFLARRPAADGGRSSGRDARRRGKRAAQNAPARVEIAPRGAAITSARFRADAGLGRSYGLLSGDVNPIHLFDLTARAFGFRGAIAHGMWTLARCATELEAAGVARDRFALDVQFRLPVLLPASLLFERWAEGEGTAFALRDSQGGKLHLSGSVRPIR